MILFTTNGNLNCVIRVDSISSTTHTRYKSKVQSGKLEFLADQSVEEILKLNRIDPECLESMLNVTDQKK